MEKINVCGFDKETELEHLHEEKEYKNEPYVCPMCKKECTLKYRPVCFTGDTLYFEYYCEECGCEGEEHYDMVFTGHTFYDEEEGKEIELYA